MHMYTLRIQIIIKKILTRLDCFSAGKTSIISETDGVSFCIQERLPVNVDFIRRLIFAIDGLSRFCSSVSSFKCAR